jgi:hypothetical protein
MYLYVKWNSFALRFAPDVSDIRAWFVLRRIIGRVPSGRVPLRMTPSATFAFPSGLERTKTATMCFSESNAGPKTQRSQ